MNEKGKESKSRLWGIWYEDEELKTDANHINKEEYMSIFMGLDGPLLFREVLELNRFCAPEVAKQELAEKKSVNLSSPFENPNIYCKICHKEYLVTKFSSHLSKFPHCELELMKKQYSSETMSAIYSVVNGNIMCKLCDVKIQSLVGFQEHSNGKRHKKKFNHKSKINLPKDTVVNSTEKVTHDVAKDVTNNNKTTKETNGMAKVIKDVDKEKTKDQGEPMDARNNEITINGTESPKYFYCKSCDQILSRTSEAKCHCDGNMHLKRLEWYCKKCGVSNSSQEMLFEHQKSRKHIDNISEDDTSEFQEVQKLLNNLYNSKILPPNVALEYLKKINRELEELKYTHRDKVVNTPSSPGFSKEYKLESFIVNKSTGNEVLTVTIEAKTNNKPKDKVLYPKMRRIIRFPSILKPLEFSDK